MASCHAKNAAGSIGCGDSTRFIPDLVQTISQSGVMVDIDEDAEEPFFQDAPLHQALQPTGSAPNFVLGSSSTSQIKINSSKQYQKKTCAACRCKGSGNRKWCTCVVTDLHRESKR